MNNLINKVLLAVSVASGLVLLSPASEPQALTQIEIDVPSAKAFIDFPAIEEGKKWSIIVLTSNDWETNPQEKQVIDMLQTSVSWQTDKAKVWHFPKSSEYQAGFVAVYGDDYPVVAVQSFDGFHHYKASNGSVPKDAKALAGRIMRGIGKFRPIKAITHRRQKKQQDCVDGQCTPHRGRRRPFGFLRPFRNPDGGDGGGDGDSDGREPPPVAENEPLVFPDNKAPIPDSVSVSPVTEPKSYNSLLALLAVVGGAVVGMFPKQGS